MLEKGKWTGDWQPVQGNDSQGKFVRQGSGFRNWVTPDGTAGPTGVAGFPTEPNRYHLYVALTCPWASRTLMARKLKGLEGAVGVSVVEPVLTDKGWRFGDYPGASADSCEAAHYLHEIYTKADPGYSGRATVPVLWDKQSRTIVNNESADILRMLSSSFDSLATCDIDLYPEVLRPQIDSLGEYLYESLNNGVYRAGLAQSQAAYDAACGEVFAALDAMEARLTSGPYLFGARLTESDIRLFVTLVRFDSAYHGIFKCNLRRIADYPHLSRYLQSVFSVRGVADTVSFDHIKRGYYSIKSLNPSLIVPCGPDAVLLPRL